ncbi:tigger transposable element-derived protein 1 [Trichonephila clavipes]|nr:tigger transposable element-derived protein 1 [Trichonephila clavipes]
MHGESPSADKEAAEKYCLKFQEFIEAEGYRPQQMLNCDETGLFWKRMPNRTYITKDEKSVPGHKPMKDRLTLLLEANASGDMKLKPLLVYYSENPRAIKRNSIIKSKLPVMWRSNQRAWSAQDLFKEWLFKVCAPSIKDYLDTNDLPLKALLLLDNAPGYPKDLKDIQGDGGDQGDTPEIIDEILTTAGDLELEVNEDDIEVLIMGHEDELTTEELQEILKEEHQET